MQSRNARSHKPARVTTVGRQRTAGQTLRGRKGAQAVRIAANEYCLLRYATGYTSGVPRRLTLKRGEFWIVPVVLTSPGYGVVGEVGIVAVDPRTHRVVGATPRNEVLAAGSRLAKEKRGELDTAFRRARTP